MVNHQNNASKELYEKQDLASNDYEYDLNDEQVWNILDQLPEEYLTSYSKWLTVASVLKRHGKHAIWSDGPREEATTTKPKTKENGTQTKAFWTLTI